MLSIYMIITASFLVGVAAVVIMLRRTDLTDRERWMLEEINRKVE